MSENDADTTTCSNDDEDQPTSGILFCFLIANEKLLEAALSTKEFKAEIKLE